MCPLLNWFIGKYVLGTGIEPVRDIKSHRILSAFYPLFPSNFKTIKDKSNTKEDISPPEFPTLFFITTLKEKQEKYFIQL